MGESILIVGCGVFGLSAALELAQRGYNVTALDAFPVPSPWSAACDYNKIVRCEYEELVYTKLSVEAMDKWNNDPLYKLLYNHCGRILITPELHQGRKEFEATGIANLKSLGLGNDIVYGKGGKQLAQDFDFLKYNVVPELVEFKWNPSTGIGLAAKSLVAVYEAAKAKGVKFVFNDSGRVVKFVSNAGKDYVECADGSTFTADKILVSSGAATGRILDLKQQQSATGLFVTHLKLTESEFKKYKDIPVVFDSDLGYFFPPDPETRIIKIALPGVGVQNYVKSNFRSEIRSLPRYKNESPTDTMPVECIPQAKRLLATYIPELAYHKLIDHKTCWIADTADSNYIIDKVPYLTNTFVAAGCSGHAYKLLPNIGKYISDMLEGKLNKELSELWRWREDTDGFDPNKISWRIPVGEAELSKVNWIVTSDQERVSRL